HESWVTTHVCYVRSRIHERHIEVDQIPRQVAEWRRVLVSETVVDRDFRVDLPGVVDVVGLARCTEPSFRERYGSLGLLFVAKQKVGESVSGAGSSKVRSCDWLEIERPTGKLITQLVVLIPAQFATQPE